MAKRIVNKTLPEAQFNCLISLLMTHPLYLVDEVNINLLVWLHGPGPGEYTLIGLSDRP